MVPLLIHWMTNHPSEAFDLPRAEKEFHEHAAIYRVEKMKAATERQNRKDKTESELSEFCRELAEQHFEVILSDADGEHLVQWSHTIKDPETHERIGTVRELFPFAWVRPSLNPCDPLQKSNYLYELKRLFDGTSTSHIHARNLQPPFAVEKAPFKKRPAQFYNVSIKLRWKTE